MKLLVDLSSNNHPGNAGISYATVRVLANVDGAYVKATEGIDYRNHWFSYDVNGFGAQGMITGAYHFARPLLSDPARQADFFLAAIRGMPLQLPAMLDLESGEQLGWLKLAAWTSAFVQRIESAGQECGVYMNRYYLANMPGVVAGRKLWLAAPGANPAPICWLWQYGTQQIAGIPGKTDVNRLLGDQPAEPSGGGTLKLNKPIVGPPIFTVSGNGYWLVAEDGGIFAFGDAEPFGGNDPLPGEQLGGPITGAARSPAGHGLLLTGSDGGVYSFGDAPFYGSVPGLPG